MVRHVLAARARFGARSLHTTSSLHCGGSRAQATLDALRDQVKELTQERDTLLAAAAGTAGTVAGRMEGKTSGVQT